MSSIHQVIIAKVEDELEEALIDTVPTDDEARVGVVKQGPLQGEPDPDDARISVTVYENDPHSFFGTDNISSMGEGWEDEVQEIEIGGTVIWKRRFCVLGRCLFVNTQEELAEAQEYAREIRERIEDCLLNISWTGVVSDSGEYVSSGAIGSEIKGEMVQAGGPPSDFDYFIKVRFDVHSTKGVSP